MTGTFAAVDLSQLPSPQSVEVILKLIQYNGASNLNA